jgi:hypothetical protein
MHLVALVGFKGSGKDTAGRFLVDNYGYKTFSFAESLKDALASIFCWDRELLSGDTLQSREWRETVDPWWSAKLNIPNFTPRLAMQLVGTNVFRQHFNPDIWILNIERKLSLLPSNSNVVLCDGRFPNELNLGRQFEGRVVRIKRGPEPIWYDVAKEANEIDPFDFTVQTKACIARDRMEKEFQVHESEWAWIGQKLDVTIENDASIERLHQEMLRVCL